MTSQPSEDGQSAAEVAAALYASFLRVPIPGCPAMFFTQAQAFELTRTLLHAFLEDET